jgi:hypothetical protein
LDWADWLTNWGFPPDVVDELTKIFQAESDPSVAQARALAYIRGTDWYAQTFPGIQDAEKLGLVNDEAGYRALLNDQNQIYRQHFGRDITTAEFAANLKSGISTAQLDAHFSGQEYIAATQGQLQFEQGAFGGGQGVLSDRELSAYGDLKYGINNPLGQVVNQKVQQAQARLAKVFQGTLATPSLSILNTGNMAVPGLAGANNQVRQPDVAA